MANKLAALIACSIAFGAQASHAAPLSDARIKEVLSATSVDAVRLETLRSRDRDILSALGETLSLKYGSILEGSEMLFTRMVDDSVIYYRLDFVGLKNKEHARALCEALEISRCISIGKTGEMLILKAEGDEAVSVLGVIDEDAPIVLLSPEPPKSYNPQARSVEASVRAMIDPLGVFPIRRPVEETPQKASQPVADRLSQAAPVAEKFAPVAPLPRPAASIPTPVARPDVSVPELRPVARPDDMSSTSSLPSVEMEMEGDVGAQIEVFEYFDDTLVLDEGVPPQADQEGEPSPQEPQVEKPLDTVVDVQPDTDAVNDESVDTPGGDMPDATTEAVDEDRPTAPSVMDELPVTPFQNDGSVPPPAFETPDEIMGGGGFDVSPPETEGEIFDDTLEGESVDEDAAQKSGLFNDRSRFGDFFAGQDFVDVADVSDEMFGFSADKQTGLMGTTALSSDALVVRLPGLGRVDFSGVSAAGPSIKSAGGTRVVAPSVTLRQNREVAVAPPLPAAVAARPVVIVEPVFVAPASDAPADQSFTVASVSDDVVRMVEPIRMAAPAVPAAPAPVLPRGPMISFDLENVSLEAPSFDQAPIVVASIDAPVQMAALAMPKMERPVTVAPKERAVAVAELNVFLAQKAVEEAELIRLAAIKPHDDAVSPIARTEQMFALAAWRTEQHREAQIALAQAEQERVLAQARAAEEAERLRIAAIKPHDDSISPMPRAERLVALASWTAEQTRIALLEEERLATEREEQLRVAALEEERLATERAEQTRLAELEQRRIAEESKLAQIAAERIAQQERVAALKLEAERAEIARIAAIKWHDDSVTPLPREQRFIALASLQAEERAIALAEAEEQQRIADAAAAERAVAQLEMQRAAEELRERQLAESEARAAEDLRVAELQKEEQIRTALADRARADALAEQVRQARNAAPMIVADIRTPGSVSRPDFTVAMVEDIIEKSAPLPTPVKSEAGSTLKTAMLGSVRFNDTYAVPSSVDFGGGSQMGRLQKMPQSRPDLSVFASRRSDDFQRVSSSDGIVDDGRLALEIANGLAPRSDFAQVPGLFEDEPAPSDDVFTIIDEPEVEEMAPTTDVSPLDQLLAAPQRQVDRLPPEDDTPDANVDIFSDVFDEIPSQEEPVMEPVISDDQSGTLLLEPSMQVSPDREPAAQNERPRLTNPVAPTRPTFQPQAPVATPQAPVVQPSAPSQAQTRAEADRRAAIEVLNEIALGSNGTDDWNSAQQAPVAAPQPPVRQQMPQVQQPVPQAQPQVQPAPNAYAIDERDPLPGYYAEREVAPAYVTPSQRIDQDRAAAIARDERVQQQQNTGYNKADLRIELSYVGSREEVARRVEELRGFFPPVMLSKGRFFGAALPGVPGRFIVGIEATDLQTRDDLVWYMDQMAMPWTIRR
jgi:hypothetical protein